MAGVDSLIRAAVRMTIAGAEQVNVLYFKQLSAGGDMGGLSDAIKTTLYDVVKNGNPATWLLNDITISEQVVGGGAQLITTYNTAGANANPGGSVVDAACIKLGTGLAGRSHRGRQYVPICAQGIVVDGSIIGLHAGNLQAAYNAFLAIYGASGTDTDYTWGIWSRKLGDILDPVTHRITGYNVAAGFFPMTVTHLDTVARVQRRRELGVGA